MLNPLVGIKLQSDVVKIVPQQLLMLGVLRLVRSLLLIMHLLRQGMISDLMVVRSNSNV